MDFVQLIQWTLLLFGSLFILIKGADFLIDGAKDIGVSLKIKPFIIGVFIVGFGTSLPEMASSIAAVIKNTPEIVIANVVGSNITNILLVVGLTALVGGTIIIKENLLKSELPIFFISTVHFIFIIQDGVVDRVEAFLLLGTFGAYVWYIFNESHIPEIVGEEPQETNKIKSKSVLLLIGGLIGVLAGANYSVEMVINIAEAFSVSIGLVSILAIAIGTSLPELIVSMRAIKTGETAMAIGNIFGSSAFNILMVAGIPALIMPLIVDDVVINLGVSVLIAASAIFFVSGLARQITRWEGLMMLIFFGFFLVKLTDFI